MKSDTVCVLGVREDLDEGAIVGEKMQSSSSCHGNVALGRSAHPRFSNLDNLLLVGLQAVNHDTVLIALAGY